MERLVDLTEKLCDELWTVNGFFSFGRQAKFWW